MDDRALIQLAVAAREHAYVPYSHFRVGAALLAKSGMVYTGCNIENVAYSPTLCAERVAIGSAVAAGEAPGSFEVMAVVGSDPDPSTPCGVCRQVLAEMAPGLRVIMAGASGEETGALQMSIEELLPRGFTFNVENQ